MQRNKKGRLIMTLFTVAVMLLFTGCSTKNENTGYGRTDEAIEGYTAQTTKEPVGMNTQNPSGESKDAVGSESAETSGEKNTGNTMGESAGIASETSGEKNTGNTVGESAGIASETSGEKNTGNTVGELTGNAAEGKSEEASEETSEEITRPEYWWEEYSFTQGENGAIFPQAIEPDLSVAYEISEADYTVVPQDIKGMFTKESFPRVDGSTATIPISEAIYQYATGATEEEAEDAIVHTKTSRSYYNLFDKKCDILIVYEPSAEVVRMMKDNPCIIRPIGLDALVFMANTNNPVESLTLGQLQRIYTGQLDNWSMVGGEDKPILAFQRPIGTGSQNLINKVVMGDIPMAEGDNVFYFSEMDMILDAMLSYNGEDNSLGYSVFYYANNMYYLPELRFMAVDGVMPSVQTISDGSYKLVNPFYAVIRADEPEDSDAHKLFDWLTSDTAQQMMMDLGYVPVNMPENAEFGGEQTFVKGNAEIINGESLKEGEYFIYYNPADYDDSPAVYESLYDPWNYGDVIIFNCNWEPIATFYNVRIDYRYLGVYDGDVIGIEQLRSRPDGSRYFSGGIYDIAAGKYSYTVEGGYLFYLDAKNGRFIRTESFWDYADHVSTAVIDRYGNELFRENVVYSEDGWLTICIRKEGECYHYSEYGYFDEDVSWYDPSEHHYYTLDFEEIDKETALQLSAGYNDDNLGDEIFDSGIEVTKDTLYVNKEAVLVSAGKASYDNYVEFGIDNGIYHTELKDGYTLWYAPSDKVISFASAQVDHWTYQYWENGYKEPDRHFRQNFMLNNYVITKEGRAVWKSENPTVLRVVSGGYLQDFISNYNTVYDCRGNKIIRKLNKARTLD